MKQTIYTNWRDVKCLVNLYGYVVFIDPRDTDDDDTESAWMHPDEAIAAARAILKYF